MITDVDDRSRQDAVVRGLARQVTDVLAMGTVREGPARQDGMQAISDRFAGSGHPDADPAERWGRIVEQIGNEGLISPEDVLLLAAVDRRIVAGDPEGWAAHFREVAAQDAAYGAEEQISIPGDLAITVAAKIGKAEFEGGPLPEHLDLADGTSRLQAGIRAARDAQDMERPEGAPVPGHRHGPENMREVAHLSRRYALLIEGAGKEDTDLKAWSARGLLRERVQGSVLERDVASILPPHGTSAAVLGPEAAAVARRIAVRAEAIADVRERQGRSPLHRQAASIEGEVVSGTTSKGPSIPRSADILAFPAMDASRGGR